MLPKGTAAAAAPKADVHVFPLHSGAQRPVGLVKQAGRLRREKPAFLFGGVFEKPHHQLDVFVARPIDAPAAVTAAAAATATAPAVRSAPRRVPAVMSAATHDALVAGLNTVANSTRDHFVSSYQNVICQNLFMRALSTIDPADRVRGSVQLAPFDELQGEADRWTFPLSAVECAQALADLRHPPDAATLAARSAKSAPAKEAVAAPRAVANASAVAGAAAAASSELIDTSDYRWVATSYFVKAASQADLALAPKTASQQPVATTLPYGATRAMPSSVASTSAASDAARPVSAPTLLTGIAAPVTITRCGRIQDLSPAENSGVYGGVDAIFHATWPVLSGALQNWRAPRKHDGCDDPRPESDPALSHRLGKEDDEFAGVDEADCGAASGPNAPWHSDAFPDHMFGNPFASGVLHHYDAGMPYHASVPHPFATQPTAQLARSQTADAKRARKYLASMGVEVQVVVKAQKVVVQPGATYKGLWHEEGLRERVIAVAVYYYSVPPDTALSGGGVQFASKEDVSTDFRGAEHLRAGWQRRSKVMVDIDEPGTLMVFSNYQTVHRVLEMYNATDKPLTREFVCLFVIDPRHRVPSTVRLTLYRQALAHMSGPAGDVVAAVLPPELQELVLAYTGELVGPLRERKALRESAFAEQMKPKQLGAWVLYSAGNGDCMGVSWSSNPQSRDGFSALVQGTSDDNEEPITTFDARPEHYLVAATAVAKK